MRDSVGLPFQIQTRCLLAAISLLLSRVHGWIQMVKEDQAETYLRMAMGMELLCYSHAYVGSLLNDHFPPKTVCSFI